MCHHSYLENKRDCHESIQHYKGDPHYEPVGEYTGPVHASVLDFGADPSGHQLQVLSRYFDVRCFVETRCCTIWCNCFDPQGPMVGWSLRTPLASMRPSEDLTAADIGNFSLVFGEHGACLPFQGANCTRCLRVAHQRRVVRRQHL